MKRNSIILGLLCLATTLLAQQPQPLNGDFENWGSITSPYQAEHWTSSGFVDFLGITIYDLLEPTTDSKSGNYAAKMVTKKQPSLFFLNIPGGCTNGNVQIDAESLSINFNEGQTFNARPVAFTGWYKYTPGAGGDVMTVICILKKGNDTVALAEFINSEAVSEYTQFSVDFDYESNETPDMMLIIMASSEMDIINAKTGSTLIIDDLAFTYPSSVKTYETSATIYPNPAKDFVYISNTEATISRITVFDIAGREILQKNTLSQNSVEIPVSEWMAGIYFAKIETDNGIITRKINVVK